MKSMDVASTMWAVFFQSFFKNSFSEQQVRDEWRSSRVSFKQETPRHNSVNVSKLSANDKCLWFSLITRFTKVVLKINTRADLNVSCIVLFLLFSSVSNRSVSAAKLVDICKNGQCSSPRISRGQTKTAATAFQLCILPLPLTYSIPFFAAPSSIFRLWGSRNAAQCSCATGSQLEAPVVLCGRFRGLVRRLASSAYRLKQSTI